MIRRIINTAVFGYFALVMVLILLLGFRWHTHRKAPTQPIAFSHLTRTSVWPNPTGVHGSAVSFACLYFL